MSSAQSLDAYLVEWRQLAFNSRQTKRLLTRGMTGVKLPRKNSVVAPTADDVRRHLRGIAGKRPQVMVRISGGGKGMAHIRAHLSYISRNGKLKVEDQNGERILGRDELTAVAEEWQYGGMPIEEVSGRREAYNIVLSMPAGTDAQALLRAVRDFARDEFSGHQYAMVLHTEDGDPARAPSPHPHVHLCVKARDENGVRLNPRKEDLRRWRGHFAERLRERGIEVAATSRFERLQPERSTKQSVRHVKARGETLRDIGRRPVQADRAARAKEAESAMLRRYGEIVRALARSSQQEDRALAAGLVDQLIKSRRAERDRDDGHERQR